MQKLVATTERDVAIAVKKPEETKPAGHIYASFQQLLVLQRKVNRPRGHKCLMA